jgi:hypothetical protein
MIELLETDVMTDTLVVHHPVYVRDTHKPAIYLLIVLNRDATETDTISEIPIIALLTDAETTITGQAAARDQETDIEMMGAWLIEIRIADVVVVTEGIVTGEMTLAIDHIDVMTMTEIISTKIGEMKLEGQWMAGELTR